MTDPVITFEPSAHEYRVDGVVKRSCTQVLSDAGLSDFSNVPDEILWEAQQRGTMVHRAAHFINRYELDPETVDERIAGYVEAWRKFRREWKIMVGHSMRGGKIVMHSELIVYRRITVDDKEVIRPAVSDLELIGTLDLECSMFKIGQVVIDIKTGEKTDAWGPQLALYTRAFSAAARHTHKRVVVQVRKNGTYKLHWFPMREFARDWEIGRKALIEAKRKELAAA